MNPLTRVRDWFEEAAASGLIEAERMALATATPDGRPSVRIVLLKGIDDDSISFFRHCCSGMYPGRASFLYLIRELQQNRVCRRSPQSIDSLYRVPIHSSTSVVRHIPLRNYGFCKHPACAVFE